MGQEPVRAGEPFRYEGWTVDPRAGVLHCAYALGERRFTERFRVDGAPEAWDTPAARAAARLVFLVAGVSYYKTGAPRVIDLGDTAVTPRERAFLYDLYRDGLGEFAYRNGIDLSDIVVEGPDKQATPAPVAATERPLVPFGGGIDSIVVTEQVRAAAPDAALFVASHSGSRFAAIEDAAAVAGLPVVRADRDVDEQVLRSRENGFLNGHVPVTAIVSAVAVLAAVLDGRDAVVMSNEHSASDATLVVNGRAVNHQWSKSLAFETAFRDVLADALPGLAYFSALRPFSELWVAQRFAALERYHLAFRSCNRAFHVDAAQRLDRWCGRCDKCCFIDLVLAPFVDADRLRAVFGGAEPLANPDLEGRFRALLGDDELVKPWECVGDVDECRAAVLLAAARPDRAEEPLLQRLAQEIPTAPDVAALLAPIGPHYVEPRYAPADLLV